MWLRRKYKGDDDLINLDKVIKISKDGGAVIRFFYTKDEHDGFLFESTKERDDYYKLLISQIGYIVIDDLDKKFNI